MSARQRQQAPLAPPPMMTHPAQVQRWCRLLLLLLLLVQPPLLPRHRRLEPAGHAAFATCRELLVVAPRTSEAEHLRPSKIGRAVPFDKRRQQRLQRQRLASHAWHS